MLVAAAQAAVQQVMPVPLGQAVVARVALKRQVVQEAWLVVALPILVQVVPLLRVVQVVIATVDLIMVAAVVAAAATLAAVVAAVATVADPAPAAMAVAVHRTPLALRTNRVSALAMDK
jgi:hypothetical protein